MKTLVNGDKYGYEIIKEVEEYSNGKIQLKQPSLYSSLSRFEEKQFVSSYWCDSDMGGRRHYYHLTDLGFNYYKKFVLKEPDEDQVVEENQISEHVIEDIIDDNSEVNNDTTRDSLTIETEQTINKEEFFLDKSETNEFIDQSDSIESETETDDHSNQAIVSDNQPILEELPTEHFPAFIDKNIVEQEQQEIIPDHVFHKVTPLEDMSNKDISSSTIDIDKVGDAPETLAWKNLSDATKKSNKNFSEHFTNKLYIKKPKKEYKIYRDKDGILRMRDETYVPKKSVNQPIIIDNVIKRTKENTAFGYTTYTNNSEKKEKPSVELTEEEKLKRNENFLAKFNLLTKSKMKPVSAPTPKPIEDKPEKSIDYISKLDAIYNTTLVEENSVVPETEVIEENNMFNYIEEESWQEDFTPANETLPQEDEEDKFIEFDAVKEFETKQDTREYIEKINNYSNPVSSQIKISRYENTTHAVLMDKTYLLHNKLKFVFGIVMSLIMALELTASLFIFKSFDMFTKDKSMFIGGFIIIGIFAILTILPFIFNPNSHKATNFKFKYTFWFGILTFLVCLILIYCTNALYGFELDNFSHFAVKLIVPSILSFNFIIGPIIYALLSKNKSFYD